MKEIVVDASIALAWGFPDEVNQYADSVLNELEDKQILVPPIWTSEITNAILIAHKQKRVSTLEIQRFIDLLEGLTIKEVSIPLHWSISNILPLAQKYDLSAYDASYLAVAIRHDAAIASLDTRLVKAAKKSDIEIISGEK